MDISGAAKVTITELDLTTRVPSFPGVYIGVVLKAPKGQPWTVTYNSNEVGLLNKYTKRGVIDVGDDLGFFSATAALQQSDKVMVTRVVNDRFDSDNTDPIRYGYFMAKEASDYIYTNSKAYESGAFVTYPTIPDGLYQPKEWIVNPDSDYEIMVGGEPSDNQQPAGGWDNYGTYPFSEFQPEATVSAGSFVTGTTYTIVVTGTTDFTTVGAANSDPSTVFVATGPGDAATTGTASTGVPGTPCLAWVRDGNGNSTCESCPRLIKCNLLYAFKKDTEHNSFLLYAVDPGVWNDDVAINIYNYRKSQYITMVEDIHNSNYLCIDGYTVDKDFVALGITGTGVQYDTQNKKWLTEINNNTITIGYDARSYATDESGDLLTPLSFGTYNYTTMQYEYENQFWCTGEPVIFGVKATAGYSQVNQSNDIDMIPDTANNDLAQNQTYYIVRKRVVVSGVTYVKYYLATSYDNALAAASTTVTSEGVDTNLSQFIVKYDPTLTAIPLLQHNKYLYYIRPLEEKTKVPNSFDIDVYYYGALKEQWICSKDINGKDGNGRNIYIEEILKGSSFIRAKDNVSNINPPASVTNMLNLGGGWDNPAAVTDGMMIDALQAFSNPDDVPLTVMMAGGCDTVPYFKAIQDLVESRKDCVGIIYIPYVIESSSGYLENIIDYKKSILNMDSSYMAIYTPHARVYDRYNDRYLYVQPDGYAAAAISYSASNYEIWYPPAGWKRGLMTVLDLKRRYDAGEMDELYNNNINPLRFAPGRGILIWGQKTLQANTSVLDRLNVSLMLIVIEPALKIALEYVLWELETDTLMAQVSSIITSYMNGIKARRGVYDFQVICDRTNNSGEDIDNHVLNVWLLVKPTVSVEYIPCIIALTRTGMSFDVARTMI